MHKILIVTIFLMATQQSNAIEFNHSVGMGLQYAGIIGWQGALKQGKNKGKISLGILGFALGYERAVSNNWAIGGSVFGSLFITATSANINYYFSSINSAGWSAGLDLIRLQKLNIFTNSKNYENTVFFSAGYHF